MSAAQCSGGGRPGGGDDFFDEEKGYWCGGPVVVRVGKYGSVYMSECRIASDRGTALLVEGQPPGDLPYLLEEEGGGGGGGGGGRTGFFIFLNPGWGWGLGFGLGVWC